MKNKLVLPTLIIAIALIIVVNLVLNYYSNQQSFSLAQKCHNDASDYVKSKQNEGESMSKVSKSGIKDARNLIYSEYNKNLNSCIALIGDYLVYDKIKYPNLDDNFIVQIDDVLTGKTIADWTTAYKANSNIDPDQSFGSVNGKIINNPKEFNNELHTFFGTSQVDIQPLPTSSPISNAPANIFDSPTPSTDTIPSITDQISAQNDLETVINSDNNPNLKVKVTKLIGNYAAGSIGDGYTGSVWYAVKIEGQWKEVWSGQNIISCKPVQQYNIPKEIYVGPNGSSECSNNY